MDAASINSDDEVEQFDDGASEDAVGDDDDLGEGNYGLEDEDDNDEESDTSSEQDEDDDDDASSQEDYEEYPGPQAATVATAATDIHFAAPPEGPPLPVREPLTTLTRSESPTLARRTKFRPPTHLPRSYAIDVICALPHPVQTHALASSLCATHLLTGSDDGFVRDYDIFTACNGKNFLTAPQRQHCGFVEGVIKAAVSRAWWDAYHLPAQEADSLVEPKRIPIYSLLAHSDALWGLAALKSGEITLFTIRHEPGKILHTFAAHKKPISAMVMLPDEKSFLSAGWDGKIKHWDLNNGLMTSQLPAEDTFAPISLSSLALRPTHLPPQLGAVYPRASDRTTSSGGIVSGKGAGNVPSASSGHMNDDAASDNSYDPLFDDEPDQQNQTGEATLALPGVSPAKPKATTPRNTDSQALPFTHNVPLLDDNLSARFSSDVFLAAYFNGQVLLWDRRSQGQAGRLPLADKCPPWCLSACWSADGAQIYAGRRNGAIDVWDIRQLGAHTNGALRMLRTLRNPVGSGEVSCVVALPDGKHLAGASLDNIRLWTTVEQEDARSRASQFKIVTGHHGGVVSQMLVDPTARFLISASGNRGWYGESTKTVLVHEIRTVQ